MVSSDDLPISLPRFLKSIPMEEMAANFVGKNEGESSLLFKMSVHWLTVSKRRKVSPTAKIVAKHLAINFLAGGPGFELIW
jgi:hypothetical protein